MIYFISDAHLGSRAMQHQRTQERRLVRFLDQIKDKAEAIYMLGDMFDFWFEYDDVVPRGFTRFLGKLSELTDSGVDIHYFVGNHDMWMDDYLTRECGVIIHHEPCLIEIHGKEFYLAHGHDQDVDPNDWKSRLMFNIFESKTCRFWAKKIHPHPFINFGLNWAKHNRERHIKEGEPQFRGERDERLVVFAKKYLAEHPGVNYFMFGHRHIELDMMLSHECRMMILGEWFKKFTFATFNGETLTLDNYIEGETQM
ncbi:MAG: UDP-2,3-diacylglucosamine diphosphatase [Prevotellaceae bacterium]|nr:UDP-2,3-diacylglucosamine diphosphatase [Candidatus Colivivens caballi]